MFYPDSAVDLNDGLHRQPASLPE